MTRQPLPCVLLLLLLLLLGSAQADPRAWGRWEGRAQIPGAALPMVVDLQAGQGGAWVGSVILPGRGVKGAALADLRVGPGGVSFSLTAALGDIAPPLPTEVELRWLPDGRLAGDFAQGGHRAALTLTRSGPPQADLPRPPARTLAAGLAGVWRGGYELGGYPRQVTLTLGQAAGAPGEGELLIVGRRRSVVSIDRIDASQGFVVMQSSATGVRLEGRWSAVTGRFEGHFLQGPFEAALVLQREGAAP